MLIFLAVEPMFMNVINNVLSVSFDLLFNQGKTSCNVFLVMTSLLFAVPRALLTQFRLTYL
jgi:DNA anti-recombination protein RmuC